jgi:hypothetical protein
MLSFTHLMRSAAARCAADVIALRQRTRDIGAAVADAPAVLRAVVELASRDGAAASAYELSAIHNTVVDAALRCPGGAPLVQLIAARGSSLEALRRLPGYLPEPTAAASQLDAAVSATQLPTTDMIALLPFVADFPATRKRVTSQLTETVVSLTAHELLRARQHIAVWPKLTTTAALAKQLDVELGVRVQRMTLGECVAYHGAGGRRTGRRVATLCSAAVAAHVDSNGGMVDASNVAAIAAQTAVMLNFALDAVPHKHVQKFCEAQTEPRTETAVALSHDFLTSLKSLVDALPAAALPPSAAAAAVAIGAAPIALMPCGTGLSALPAPLLACCAVRLHFADRHATGAWAVVARRAADAMQTACADGTLSVVAARNMRTASSLSDAAALALRGATADVAAALLPALICLLCSKHELACQSSILTVIAVAVKRHGLPAPPGCADALAKCFTIAAARSAAGTAPGEWERLAVCAAVLAPRVHAADVLQLAAGLPRHPPAHALLRRLALLRPLPGRATGAAAARVGEQATALSDAELGEALLMLEGTLHAEAVAALATEVLSREERCSVSLLCVAYEAVGFQHGRRTFQLSSALAAALVCGRHEMTSDDVHRCLNGARHRPDGIMLAVVRPVVLSFVMAGASRPDAAWGSLLRTLAFCYPHDAAIWDVVRGAATWELPPGTHQQVIASLRDAGRGR